MIVTFNNLLGELDFKKEVFFKENTEITKVIRVAEEILYEYDLNFLCFCFQGSWYLTEEVTRINREDNVISWYKTTREDVMKWIQGGRRGI